MTADAIRATAAELEAKVAEHQRYHETGYCYGDSHAAFEAEEQELQRRMLALVATSRRPALHDVLATVTDRPAEWWAEHLAESDPLDPMRRELSFDATEVAVVGVRDEARVGLFAFAPYAHGDVYQALEALHTRGLWPWPTDGDGVARWSYENGDSPLQPSWVRDNYLCNGAPPPSIRSIVSVASLGARALRRVEALASEVEPGAKVHWCVEQARWLASHHQAVAHARRGPVDGAPHIIFSCEASENREPPFGPPWPVKCPWLDDSVRRMWPALRAMAAEGVHVLEGAPGYMVIAAEDVSVRWALPSPQRRGHAVAR